MWIAEELREPLELFPERLIDVAVEMMGIELSKEVPAEPELCLW